MEQIESTSTGRGRQWLKRIGFAGFLFFLVKGLLWLLAAYLMAC